ncbi:hypothetical protein VOLCADRAFT_107768 [Volvox carteri f. nagariensis]|uniref:SRCR domain-containing protein n=1 Tax=Volvox carteri f. nagariensis TaxID=3068 RepID=D8UG97_VOLCA|nr:uncharacterized protein VOLCADRAFT_107768 [Volvox carteri f. nagariensis]EFJ41250.1 hypothetical protein VOLCADRAFT_107768 [Volvox carteri f. nagariensis]|eukprot:XP_002957701.1 hypothetical protein VOLCADRAFT_107768 [Volvox carteri f. nagariensis]
MVATQPIRCQHLPKRTFFAAALLLLLNCCGGGVTAGSPFIYARNGVRLVGGDKTTGRLELQTDRSWVPVCDDFYFDGKTIQIMCQLLGYNYGRKYYNPRLAYLSKDNNLRASQITCYKKPRHRARSSDAPHLRSLSAASGDQASDRPGVQSSADGLYRPDDISRHGGRNLLAVLTHDVNTSDSAPYACKVVWGKCNPRSPVGVIQCSKKMLPLAPPVPPAPPQPPSPPPPAPQQVRIIFGGSPDGGLEPNLCTGGAETICETYGRVEMEVRSPGRNSSGKVWAPVCNIPDSALAFRVASVACEQRFQMRYRPWLPLLFSIHPSVSSNPFLIPKGSDITPGNFNPKVIQGWVNITGGDFTIDSKLQDQVFKQQRISDCTWMSPLGQHPRSKKLIWGI